MGKKRHSIHAIQEALLANTSFMQPDENEAVQTAEEIDTTGTENTGNNGLEINPELLKKLRILAAYQKTTPESLVELAIEDLLALRNRQLQAAMEQLTAEE